MDTIVRVNGREASRFKVARYFRGRKARCLIVREPDRFSASLDQISRYDVKSPNDDDSEFHSRIAFEARETSTPDGTLPRCSRLARTNSTLPSSHLAPTSVDGSLLIDPKVTNCQAIPFGMSDP